MVNALKKKVRSQLCLLSSVCRLTLQLWLDTCVPIPQCTSSAARQCGAPAPLQPLHMEVSALLSAVGDPAADSVPVRHIPLVPHTPAGVQLLLPCTLSQPCCRGSHLKYKWLCS